MISMQILSPHKPTLFLRKCLLLISRCHDMYQNKKNDNESNHSCIGLSVLFSSHMWIYMYISIFYYTFLHVSMYIYVCMCMYIYICMYICIFLYVCVWECVLKNGFTFTNSRPRVVVMLTFSSLAGPEPVFIDVFRLRWWPLVVILRALGSRFDDVQTYGQLSQ